MTFTPTARTTSLRSPDKLRYDKATAYRVLDEARVCHVGYIHEGTPRVLPTAHVRVGDFLYLHGSTGSRALLSAKPDGLDVCVTATLLDGLVYSRSWFHHSVNYRCVMAHGRARPVIDDDERWHALAALIDTYGNGRSADSRDPSPKELAQTGLLSLPLVEVSVRTRQGPPREDPDDMDLPFWAGEVPLSTVPGDPIPDADVEAAVPPYIPTS